MAHFDDRRDMCGVCGATSDNNISAEEVQKEETTETPGDAERSRDAPTEREQLEYVGVGTEEDISA